KLGQPVLLSYLVSEENSGRSQPAQANVPLRFSSLSGLEPGDSVRRRLRRIGLGEDDAPFAVALLDFEAVDGLHIAAPQRPKPRNQRQRPHPRQQETTIDHGLSPSCPTAPRAGRRARN